MPWLGGAATLRLWGPSGLILERASARDGFTELRPGGLPAGCYRLDIVQPARGFRAPDGEDLCASSRVGPQGFSIAVRVLDEVRAKPTDKRSVMAAAEGLRGGPACRLESLSAIDRMADPDAEDSSSYKAWGILRSVARGDLN